MHNGIRDQLEDPRTAKLIILYGRRRIGKSRLIHEALQAEKSTLFFEGIEGEPTKVQVQQFLDDLAAQTKRVRLAANNWSQAFRGLGEIIGTGRWIIVLDEFPWMGAGRTSEAKNPTAPPAKFHYNRPNSNCDERCYPGCDERRILSSHTYTERSCWLNCASVYSILLRV